MERIVKKSHGYAEAAAWDIEQHVGLTPQERIRIARLLKRKVYSDSPDDVRACHRKE